MLDLRWICDNAKDFDEAMRRRGLEAMSSRVLGLDSTRRESQTALQEMRARRNEVSKMIGVLKSRGEDAAVLVAEVADLKERMQEMESQESATAEELEQLLCELPNVLSADVPDGADESFNVEVRRHGEPPQFDFTPKDHADLGPALGLMDFEMSAKLSGSRFVVLKGALARMERALASFMLDLHTSEFGYTEHYVPLLVRDETAFGTGQLPKFGADLFRTTAGLWLIPTAEMPLSNTVAGEILDEASLPLRLTAYTACFRSEAGAAGKDTHGMIRQHQFGKVELVSIAHPDHSDEELERMTSCAEEVLKRLGLPYRVVTLSSGDTGFCATKTYDIEVWMPGQGRYREISSCSNCGDFQARRMKARFKKSGEKGTRFVHTLNGSGIAVGRTLIAVMENYQREDGSITVPEVLRPAMGGLETIGGDV